MLDQLARIESSLKKRPTISMVGLLRFGGGL